MNWISSRLLTFLLAAAPLAASAQLEIGVRGGLVRNQVPMDFSDRVFYKSTWENRFSVGIVVFYPILDHLYAESGLTYASKRQYITRENAFDDPTYASISGVYTRTDRNYLALPLGVRLEAGNWSVGNSTFSVVLAGGGYGGYWISGQQATRQRDVLPDPNSSNPYVSVRGDYEFDNSFDPDGVKDNRWELGWYGGVALQYLHTSIGRFWVEGRFQQAVTDLSLFEDGNKPRDYQDRRNRSMRIELGYALPISNIFNR